MKFIRRLLGFVGNEENRNVLLSSEINGIRDALENGRVFRRAGQYEQALAQFMQAEQMVEAIGDSPLRAIIALSRVGILIKLGHWAEAEEILLQVQADAEKRANEPQLAYVKIVRGILSQEQDKWHEAETYYEAALKIARASHSMGAEGRAQAHLADVALHNGNASFAIYLLNEALPRLNESGDFEMSSYFVGLLGQAMIQNGQPDEGTQLLGRALRLAEQMNYREYERIWHQSLAVRAMEIGSYAEARRHFMLSLPLWKEDQPEYILTLCYLSKACLRLSEYEISLDYAQQAHNLINNESSLEIALKANAALGVVLRMMGNNAESIDYLEVASEGYDALLINAADHNYVEILRNLAAARSENGEFESAQAIYARALTYADENEQWLEVAGTYRDMGILQTREGNIEAAVKMWSQALQIYEQQEQHARVARLYCDLARLKTQQGHPQRALENYAQALMLLSSIDDDETRGIVLSNAATAYVDQGDIETSEAFFIESIKLAQKTNDRAAEATRRGNYGWFLLSTGRAERAIASLSYALRQSENLGMALQAAVQTDNIALAYGELGQYAEARKFHQQALEGVRQIGDRYWELVIMANLSRVWVALGQFVDAKTMIEDINAMNDLQNQPEIKIKVGIVNAQIAIHEGDNKIANDQIDAAVRLATRTGMRRLLADALVIRSSLHPQDNLDAANTDWGQARKLYEILHLPLERRIPEWVQNETTT